MLSYDAGIISPQRSVEIDAQAFDIGKEMLMIYTRDQITISLGRFSPEDSYDQEYARSNGMAVVRRISGGSPIFTDRGQITITYVSPRENFPSKESSYEYFGKCLVEALNSLDIKAEYKPVNDVLLNGKKISGSAQYRDEKTVLMHGSLILKKGKHFDCLRPEKEVKYPVTSIEDECGFVPTRKELLDALEASFSD